MFAGRDKGNWFASRLSSDDSVLIAAGLLQHLSVFLPMALSSS